MSWVDKNGRLHASIMLKGKRVHRILPRGATEGDAKLVEAELRVALSKKKPNSKVAAVSTSRVHIPGDPPLTEILALYVEHTSDLRSPSTAVHHANRFGPWAAKYRASEAKQAARHFIKDCKTKYAPSTINWSLSCLRKGLELAFDDELTPINYASLVKSLPVHNARDTVLTMAQINTLSKNLSEQARAVMWIALYTGCRRGEILAMKAKDIGPDTILVRSGNTKTLKTRVIPIVEPLRPWLKYIPIGINFEGVASSWDRARAKAQLPELQFKDLRRSCATMMIAAGVDLYVVSKLLGHASVEVTQKVYAHLMVERVAAGMKSTFEITQPV